MGYQEYDLYFTNDWKNESEYHYEGSFTSLEMAKYVGNQYMEDNKDFAPNPDYCVVVNNTQVYSHLKSNTKGTN